jgi:hypothetical protein
MVAAADVKGLNLGRRVDSTRVRFVGASIPLI